MTRQERRIDELILALSQADDAVSRLDERVRACAFATGWIARLDLSEAHAWGWTSGNGVGVEDLVLHEEGMDIRAPDQALRAAHGVIRARRKAAPAGRELLSVDGVSWLVAARRSPPLESGPGQDGALPGTAPVDSEVTGLARLVAQLAQTAKGTTDDADGALREWLLFLDGLQNDLPPLLRAAAALEAWTVIDPLPRHRYVGPILVGHWLRLRRRVQTHLLGVEGGLRIRSRQARDRFAVGPHERLLHWLAVFSAAANHGLDELRRLELARQVLAARLARRRTHSHLGEVVELLLERPVVTASMVAERLKVTQQSARRLISELGTSVTEISGRARFRAWRL